MDSAVQNEKTYHRFAVHLEGATAMLTYNEEGDTIYFVHTEVPPEMEGKGIGGQLAKAGLEYAREHKLKVVPRCPFVASYLQRHPEYQDLVAPEVKPAFELAAGESMSLAARDDSYQSELAKTIRSLQDSRGEFASLPATRAIASDLEARDQNVEVAVPFYLALHAVE